MQQEVLHIKKLTLGLKDSVAKKHLLVKGVDLKVHKNEVVAIIGASGSGKSLTALSVIDLLPDGVCHVDGEILFEGNNIVNFSNKQIMNLRGNDIGFVFQNPLLAFNPLKKVYKQLVEPLIIHNPTMPKHEIEHRLKEVLEYVDLQDFYSQLNSYPHQFSGGQLQRLMIAMAIINKPKLLIADEPTTALDKLSGLKVINLLNSLAKKLNLSVLIISHDLKAVKDIAQKIYVIDQGEVIESGNVENVFNNPQHSVTKLLTGKIKFLDELELNKDRDSFLDVSNLNTKYLIKSRLIFKNKYKDFLRDINFSVKEQDTIGLIGKSGTGKSSIINAVLQLHDYDGNITLCGKDISKAQNKVFMRKNIQLVFQNTSSSLNPRALVKDIVLDGINLHHKNLSNKEKMQTILELFDKMELDRHLLLRYSTELSGGQKQRVSIIRALAIKPKLLVLDEPTSALDKISEMKVMQVFREMQKQYNMAFVFISHNMDMVKSFCNKLLVVDNGIIVESGLLKDVLANPQQEVTKTLLF